ncbi:MAG: putative rane protein [Verrucomicrobiota bacterium]|jgi:putative membrane protein
MKGVARPLLSRPSGTLSSISEMEERVGEEAFLFSGYWAGREMRNREPLLVFPRWLSHRLLPMPQKLSDFIKRWAITTVAVLVAANVVKGITYESWAGLIVATLLLGFLNAFLRPFLMLLSLPLLIVTLGLFTLIINATLLYFVGQLVKTFHVASFGAAFWGGVVISLVSIPLNILTGTGNTRLEVKRGPPARDDSRSDDGDGPVIDV